MITQNGEAIAQIAPPPRATRPVQFDGMRDRVKLFPGWDEPVDVIRKGPNVISVISPWEVTIKHGGRTLPLGQARDHQGVCQPPTYFG